MTNLAFLTELRNDGRSITTSDNDDGAILHGLFGSIEQVLGSVSEGREFEDTGRSVKQ
jgi:hypothetical protein